jgi:hypothetical protein
LHPSACHAVRQSYVGLNRSELGQRHSRCIAVGTSAMALLGPVSTSALRPLLRPFSHDKCSLRAFRSLTHNCQSTVNFVVVHNEPHDVVACGRRPLGGSMRQRRATSRKPAKTQHGSTRKPKRNKVPTAARAASSTLADLQQQSALSPARTRGDLFRKVFLDEGSQPLLGGTLGGQGRRNRDRENSF